jgi:hypothetical protein
MQTPLDFTQIHGPENILIATTGTVVGMAFGISKLNPGLKLDMSTGCIVGGRGIAGRG